MAARKNHRYLRGAEPPPASASEQFELDEADVWSINDTTVLPPTSKRQDCYRPAAAPKPLRKRADVDHQPAGPRSLPLNIPEWSRILDGRDEEEEGDDGNDVIPPHEYLARTRGESLSVHEGVGRTLKGRDLNRVRNAIWKQIGFED